MALTVCLRCDKTYGENKPTCPHCGTSNFFASNDDAVILAATEVLIESIEHEERNKKLNELEDVRDQLLGLKPPVVKVLGFTTNRGH